MYNYSLCKNCNFKPYCSLMTGGSERTCLLNDEDEQMLIGSTAVSYTHLTLPTMAVV